jgi:signal recognition particle subunit SRP54
MSGLLGMLPGVGKIKQQMAESKLDDGMIGRQLAIMSSMTPKERRNPQVLHASRKRRIATGSGTSVQEINKLLKQYKHMQIMMKRVKKMGGAEKFMARGLPQGLLQR